MIKPISGHSRAINFGTNLKLKEVRVDGQPTTDPKIIKQAVDSLVDKLLPDNNDKTSSKIRMDMEDITFNGYRHLNSQFGTIVGSSFSTQNGIWYIKAGPSTELLDKNNPKAGLIIDVHEKKLPCGHNDVEAVSIDYID